MDSDRPNVAQINAQRWQPGWLTGELLEGAILRTLARHNRPLTWLEIINLGPLDHCTNAADRNSAISSLVQSGKVITESVPKPGAMWDRIEVYSIAPARSQP